MLQIQEGKLRIQSRLYFYKGKPRALKIDAKKEKAFFASHTLISLDECDFKVYVANDVYESINKVIIDLDIDYKSNDLAFYQILMVMII